MFPTTLFYTHIPKKKNDLVKEIKTIKKKFILIGFQRTV